jgi:hypothetical protein
MLTAKRVERVRTKSRYYDTGHGGVRGFCLQVVQLSTHVATRALRLVLSEVIVWLRKRGGTRLDPIVRELTLLTALACLGLGLAWAYEADYFAMFFAVTAAFAGIEAVRRSL